VSDTLKPCPFCGKVPGIVKTIHGFALYHHPDPCPQFGRFIADSFARETLIENWNTRDQGGD
jgi:hypothetical protein